VKPLPKPLCDCGRPAFKRLNNTEVICVRCWELDNLQAKCSRLKRRETVRDDVYASRRAHWVATVYPYPKI
jgi:hypothetical protein